MAETQKLLSQSDRESLPASVPASEDAALEHAKDLIDRFCKSEYFSPGEFDDLEKSLSGTQHLPTMKYLSRYMPIWFTSA